MVYKPTSSNIYDYSKGICVILSIKEEGPRGIPDMIEGGYRRLSRKDIGAVSQLKRIVSGLSGCLIQTLKQRCSYHNLYLD